MLPSWWMLLWVGGLLLALHLLYQGTDPSPSYAEGIEWPIHDGGRCLGDMPGVTMVPRHPDAAYLAGHQLPYLPLRALAKARPWRTVAFTGQPLANFTSLQLAETYLRALAADTSRAGGVRLQFGRRVSYSCFFEVLVRLDATSTSAWWLDVRHQPLTLYAVTFRKGPRPLTH